ncbi:MAG TPA: YggT family protein [Solirubrobacterales bacterium]|jgi:YggT family protein
MIPLALTSDDVANYVNALFLVYMILIFCNILMSWIPRIPRSATLRPVLDFITQTTDPYLNIFRRLLNPIGAGGMAIDISPILAIIVLVIARTIIVSAIINP